MRAIYLSSPPLSLSLPLAFLPAASGLLPASPSLVLVCNGNMARGSYPAAHLPRAVAGSSADQRSHATRGAVPSHHRRLHCAWPRCSVDVQQPHGSGIAASRGPRRAMRSGSLRQLGAAVACLVRSTAAHQVSSQPVRKTQAAAASSIDAWPRRACRSARCIRSVPRPLAWCHCGPRGKPARSLGRRAPGAVASPARAGSRRSRRAPGGRRVLRQIGVETIAWCDRRLPRARSSPDRRRAATAPAHGGRVVGQAVYECGTSSAPSCSPDAVSPQRCPGLAWAMLDSDSSLAAHAGRAVAAIDTGFASSKSTWSSTRQASWGVPGGAATASGIVPSRVRIGQVLGGVPAGHANRISFRTTPLTTSSFGGRNPGRMLPSS